MLLITAYGGAECEFERALLQELRAAPGRATLDTLGQELAKLERIRALPLSPDLFDDLAPSVLHA